MGQEIITQPQQFASSVTFNSDLTGKDIYSTQGRFDMLNLSKYRMSIDSSRWVFANNANRELAIIDASGNTTIGNQLSLSGASPYIRIIDSSAATKDEVTGVVAFYSGLSGDPGTATGPNRAGYVGFGSSTTNDMYLFNETNGGTVRVMISGSLGLGAKTVAQLGVYNSLSSAYINYFPVNVGIGTSNPNEELTVVGNISATGNITPGNKIISYGRSGTGGIHFGGETTLSGSAPITDGAVFQYHENLFGTAADGLLIEKTDVNGTVPDGGILFANRGMSGITVPALAIRGSGNVGIGTASPNADLTVVGDISASGRAYVNGLTNSGTTAGLQDSFSFNIADTMYVEQLMKGVITTSGTSYTLTLDTAAGINSSYLSFFNNPIPNGAVINFTVLNTASGIVTVAVASGITLKFGAGTGAVSPNTSKRFCLIKTGSSTFDLYGGI